MAFKVMSGPNGVTEYNPEMDDPDSMEFKKVAEAVENQVRKKTFCKIYELKQNIYLWFVWLIWTY